jgi:hypothetical protein
MPMYIHSLPTNTYVFFLFPLFVRQVVFPTPPLIDIAPAVVRRLRSAAVFVSCCPGDTE